MTQPRRTIEHLLQQGTLPLERASAAATHLEVFPTKRSWLAFFDKALLIIGVVALALSLVFFIAYNWLHMGKMGKFALVEGALVLTIALYILLSFRRKFQLVRQLLLLIASVITGSLLALFGQVYQTGADTWQLFFGWALLIIPWVLIARLPALWLLWLGLVNSLCLSYINTSIFFSVDYYYQDFWQFTLITLVNFIAFYLWLICFENKRMRGLFDISFADVNVASAPTATSSTQTNSSLHWSTYVVALLSTYSITYLTIATVFDNRNSLLFLLAFSLWIGWSMFMYWRFRKHHIDLLMLTYLCGSMIALIVFILGKALLSNFDAGGFLLLGLILIGSSSYAVVWLRKVARLNNENPTSHTPHIVVKGVNHE